MEPKSLTGEAYREYEFNDRTNGDRVYRIEDPQQLFIGTTTHRVLDKDGIVHCVPSPGQSGCVLRWKPRDTSNPVQF